MACCLGCTERSIGCHATCERYKKESEENRNKNMKIAKERAKNGVLSAYYKEDKTRRMKRYG